MTVKAATSASDSLDHKQLVEPGITKNVIGMAIDVDESETVPVSHQPFVCFQQYTETGTRNVLKTGHINDALTADLVEKPLGFGSLCCVQPAIDDHISAVIVFNFKHWPESLRLLPGW